MYFIVEYEKGLPGCKRVTNRAGDVIKFKTKKAAEERVRTMSYAGMSFIYKVYSTTRCAEGECSICYVHDCPMKGD